MTLKMSADAEEVYLTQAGIADVRPGLSIQLNLCAGHLVRLVSFPPGMSLATALVAATSISQYLRNGGGVSSRSRWRRMSRRGRRRRMIGGMMQWPWMRWRGF